MPFSLRLAPAAFSRLVQKLLRGLGQFACEYLDDILIASNSWEEHPVHLRQAFDQIVKPV